MKGSFLIIFQYQLSIFWIKIAKNNLKSIFRITFKKCNSAIIEFGFSSADFMIGKSGQQNIDCSSV